jgi:hypothetical protein
LGEEPRPGGRAQTGRLPHNLCGTPGITLACATSYFDQYRVTEDERSGIKSDPNREDDPQYIVRLVGQVVRVSLETVRIVRSLPPVFPWVTEVPQNRYDAAGIHI